MTDQPQIDTPAAQAARRSAFHARCAQLGIAVDPALIWYHSIDLGDDLVTPGIFDLRPHLEAYRFPEDMRGLTALDVGPGDGFFSFELLRRGAELSAIELPSLSAVDQLPGRDVVDLLRVAEHFLPAHVLELPAQLTLERLDHLLLDGPMAFCCRRLGIDLDLRRGTIYQLADEALGIGRRDWVFLGDVLLHVIDPVRALASAASVCADTLVIAQPVPDDLGDEPMARWRGGDDPNLDYMEWWLPNLAWYRQMLKKLGFRSIEVVGRFNAAMQATGQPAQRTIIHARR
jgi:tRNA (mo5U34)-methyltransferase